MSANSIYDYLPYLLLALGLALIALAIFWSSNNHLKQTGIEVEGIIFKQEYDTSFRNDGSHRPAPDLITVRFVTMEQEWITETIKQDFKLFYTGQYKDGEKVKVFYEKDKPKNFYVDTKQSELAGRLSFALIGLAFIGYSLYQIFWPV